jgi:hypothetical protein
MRLTHEISTDGPYLHVFLPDVVPTDWEALRRELEPELEEGASRVTVVVGRCTGIGVDDPSLLDLVGSLRSSGVQTAVVH